MHSAPRPRVVLPLVALAAACAAPRPAPTPSQSPAIHHAVLPAPAPLVAPVVAARETFRGDPLDPLLDAMAHHAVLRRAARFDSTTVVYRLELEGGVAIGFKPSVTDNPDLWRHEVAAYRLARRLGLADRVPPAVVRTVPLASLGEGTVHDRIAPLPDAPDTVPGAATYWMPVLGHSDLCTPAGEARWQAWLSADHTAPLPGDSAMAEQVSTLIVFDYLQGNDDRWSRFNLRIDEHGALIYRDNNAGWIAREMEDLGWQRARLRRVQRFRRGLIDALERTDATALAAELALDPAPSGALLGERQLRAYDARRGVVLEQVHALVARRGAAAVYAWP